MLNSINSAYTYVCSVYLKLPEDAACVSVIVVSQWDIFNCSEVFFQVAFHMFEEPRFKVQPNSVDLM